MNDVTVAIVLNISKGSLSEHLDAGSSGQSLDISEHMESTTPVWKQTENQENRDKTRSKKQAKAKQTELKQNHCFWN